jgi:prolyl oligopeptidase
MNPLPFALLLAAAAPAMPSTDPAAVAAEKAPLPETPKKPVVDEYQHVQVSEDYRWLENSDDPQVKAWGDAQTAHTRFYIDAIPWHAALHDRIDALIRSTSERWLTVLERGGVYFAEKFEPTKQQPFLVTYKSIDDKSSERVLVDPNAIDPAGKTAIDFWSVSTDGKLIAVSLSKNGSEAGDLHVYDVATAKEVGEVIPHVNNGTAGGSAAFAPDNSGFWYTRYPRGSERGLEDAGFYQQVYYHRLGTRTEDDTYELGRELPRIAEIEVETKLDGRWVLAEVKNGDGGEVEFFVRPVGAGAQWTQVSTFADRAVHATFGVDDTLYLLSRKDAPRGQVLRVPLATPTIDHAKLVVPESEGAIQEIVPATKTLYVLDLLGGPSQVRTFDIASGKPHAKVPILPVSAVHGLSLLEGDEVLYSNESYMKNTGWFRFDPKHGKPRPTALASTSIADYSDTEVVRDFAKSEDGTKVPMNIIRRKDAKLDGKTPTILYAYGGYGVSMTPGFSSVIRAWIEQGGIYVIANIRGGGEYGDQWHLNGNLLKKQNGFDDFYSCARWLVAHKYTNPSKLAISGASNGGLLMGAELTQHPEMFRAVASRVGVYDMLRVETTQNGAFNVTEYGTVKDPDQFKALYGYSPLHHVKAGVTYPSVMLTTGAHDPRVDPWHSKKFAAALQASGSSNPVLLRINAAGHGMGTSLSERIAETADLYAFLFHELGVTPQFPAR